MSILGASHVKSGKPCQDYSLHWESEDKSTQVIIVCDGHGSDTYVRSETGARLAAEVTLSNIQEFVKNTTPTLFLGKEGAVTARPAEEEDSLFHKKVSEKKDQTESEKEQYEQDLAFYDAVKDIREQDYYLTRLFGSIYLQWLQAIRDDAATNPFTEQEKKYLKDAKLVKAYGTTLIAYVATPLYWLAFHIGDGNLVCCDRNLTWREPVPWDCNCFLNMTTSLCGSNPIPSFRYAFNGKGDFPAAVIMGSDGIDDSWGSLDRLTNFYSQILGMFNALEVEETLKQLRGYLSQLSEKASRDDMSMAGIIDMNAIEKGIDIYTKQRELRSIEQEKEQKQNELDNKKKDWQVLQEEIRQMSESILQMKQESERWWEALVNAKADKEKNIADAVRVLDEKKMQSSRLNTDYQELMNQYQQWESDARPKIDLLLQESEKLRQETEQQRTNALEAWNLQKTAFEQKQKMIEEPQEIPDENE